MSGAEKIVAAVEKAVGILVGCFPEGVHYRCQPTAVVIGI